MARLVERYLPFFKAIRKAEDFAWIEDCQKSFNELKAYLVSPPLLFKPLPGEDLFLYLSVSEVAISIVSIREENNVQKPIYCVSKVVQDVETRYPKIGKMALGLITSARRLQPYFQSYTIMVLTDQPLREVLQSPKELGRLVNWSVELGEFDIHYRPRTAIKAQDLAAFIVECTLPKDPLQLVISEAQDPWVLYMDGSWALGSSGAGIILVSRENFVIKYALHFDFQASNNKAEYEALLVGIRCLCLTKSLYALQEVHKGICKQHLGGRSLTHKILRQGHYWLAMQKDGIKFTQRCEKCQKFAPVSHTPVAALSSVVSPIPFAMWGMDVPGPFLLASGQRRFVIVAIDYFTKWIEAEALVTTTLAKCKDFF
ncbi:hypothetical protein RJ639_038117 [Escallonia herrerae]|uniref:Uncharacterized protein n=1 Tax=Escallonia herrerae TaxID=1293975 RepID=A0AA88WME7_9ASTE|nr:hypothetical protein RJ639_038117 [Escallonia herrerae]